MLPYSNYEYHESKKSTNYNYGNTGNIYNDNNYDKLEKIHFIWSVSDPHFRIRSRGHGMSSEYRNSNVDSKITIDNSKSGHWAAVDYEKEYTQSFYFNMETSLPTGTYTQSNVNPHTYGLRPMSMGLGANGNSLRIDHDTNLFNMSNDMMSGTGTGITKYSGDYTACIYAQVIKIVSSPIVTCLAPILSAKYQK